MADVFATLLFQDPASWPAALLFWAAILAALAFFGQRRNAAHRLSNRVRALKLNDDDARDPSASKPFKLVQMAQFLLDQFMRARGRGSEAADTLALKMWRAGFYSATAPAWWIVVRIAFVPACAGLGVVLMLVFADTMFNPLAGGILGALFGGLVGLLLPLLYRRNRTDKRVIVLRRGWPDFLDLLALTVGAGLTLQTALMRIRVLLEQKWPDLARELNVLTAELTYFGERVRALQNLSRRCQLLEVDDLVTALVQAEQKGLPLNDLLTAMARDQRRKRRMEIEKKAASLPAKLTVPMILFFLPALLIVILAPVAFRLGEIF